MFFLVKRFDNHDDYVSFINSSEYIKPNVSSCSAETHVHYDYDYAYAPLTVEALEDLEIQFTNKIVSNLAQVFWSKGEMYYSKDGTRTWNQFTSADTISVRSGERLQFKGNLSGSTSWGIGRFIIPGKFNIVGNPLSMYYMDDFGDVISPRQSLFDLFSRTGVVSAEGLKTNIGNTTGYPTVPSHMFSKFFLECVNLEKAPSFTNLSRKANSRHMYGSTYYGCTSLTEVPDLLFDGQNITAESTFDNTFNSCTSLKKMPRIKAKTIGRLAFDEMFERCTSLTDLPPVLEVDELGDVCFSEMFKNCTALETVPKGFLPLTTLKQYCYGGMFEGCTSLKNLPDLPAMAIPVNAYADMFSGCTSIETVPKDYLPAESVSIESYVSMFNGCTSLKNAPDLPATTIGSDCYRNMFRNCESLETAPDILPAEKLSTNSYFGMFYGCISLTKAPEISALSGATSACASMFQECTGLTEAPSAIHIKKLNGVYSGMCKSMFTKCVSLKKAPVIETETLTVGNNHTPVPELFKEMFYDCSLLNEIRVKFKTSAGEDVEQFAGWVSGVDSLGTFYMPADSEWEVIRGNAGVPLNWDLIRE